MRKDNNSHNWNRHSDSKRDGKGGFKRPFKQDNDDRRSFREDRDSNYNKTKGRKHFNRNDRDFEQKERRSFKRKNDDRNSFRDDKRSFGRKRFDRNKENKPFRKRAYEQYQEEENLEHDSRKKYKGEAPKQVQPKLQKGEIRLNKYIANAGICSRREADVLITTGVITVNGETITQLGYKVQPDDVVKYNGRTLNNEKKVYILLNKPKGFITTSDDPQQRKTVLELINGACSERVYPVGRLDRNTTGLLLLTNDGDLTKKLTHPSYGAQKIYNVELDKPMTKADMDKLLNGLDLEDGIQKVDDVNYLNNQPIDKKKVGVSIHSGKNRIIRRLFEALGYDVKKLDRVYFAGLTKKNLLRGQYRFLEDREIGFLHMQQ